MAKLQKLMGVALGLLLFVPIGTAIWLGFEPMSAVITYSWGNSIITSQVKSFLVNPPLIFFLGALACSLYAGVNGLIIAAALSFLYSFLTLWLVWSGGQGEWYAVLFYSVFFAIIGLGGALAVFIVRFLYHRIMKRGCN